MTALIDEQGAVRMLDPERPDLALVKLVEAEVEILGNFTREELDRQFVKDRSVLTAERDHLEFPDRELLLVFHVLELGVFFRILESDPLQRRTSANDRTGHPGDRTDVRDMVAMTMAGEDGLGGLDSGSLEAGFHLLGIGAEFLSQDPMFPAGFGEDRVEQEGRFAVCDRKSGHSEPPCGEPFGRTESGQQNHEKGRKADQTVNGTHTERLARLSGNEKTPPVTIGGVEKMAGAMGLEPTTFAVTGRHCNRLNYAPALEQ